METKTITYVEYIYPGAFFSESGVQKVTDRDISKLDIPDGAFAFKFFDIIFTKTEDDVAMQSDHLNISGKHYIGGKLYTVDEVKRDFPDSRTLISNLVGNGHTGAIHCRTGNWQPFDEGDIYIEEDSA